MHKTLIVLGIVALVGCTPREATTGGPRLVNDVALATSALTTLGMATLVPLLVLSPEVPVVLQLPTSDAEVVIVTPTMPPSKTPTRTPTFTLTPTVTQTPTITATSSATAFVLPTSEIRPLNGIVLAPNNQICDSNWFFLQPLPANCPMNAPNASPGVYQTFQNGTMVWVGSQDAIYVMYNDALAPKWEVVRDYFNEGMVEQANDFNPPSETLFQPRRGFGMLWRGNELVRNRIGWSMMKDEQPFSVQVQTARDGAIYISAPSSNLFGLLPGGAGWNLYSMVAGSQIFVMTPIFVPLPTALSN